jgi:hypothetical protein
VHRRGEFRASKIMVDRAEQNEKLDFVLNATVEEIIGDVKVEGLKLRNTITDELWEVPADGLFVAIGHDPNTALFVDQLDHDDGGYLITKPGSTETNIPGVSPPATRIHLSAGDHRCRLEMSGCARRGASVALEGHPGTAMTAPRPEAARFSGRRPALDRSRRPQDELEAPPAGRPPDLLWRCSRGTLTTTSPDRDCNRTAPTCSASS